MDRRGFSLAEIQEVPKNSLVLLAGPPGAGKSTFCHQVVLNGLAMDKPVIFVTTEQRPAQVMTRLSEKGLGEPGHAPLSFVDAYSQTVGVESPERPDTIYANCMDLNSISIATTKLQERMGQSGKLLAFDSLTSPYLFSGAEVAKFMRLFLSKFAAEGNSVLAVMDEGCGKEEDLVAMMSVADGIITMEIEESTRVINVVKHPKVEPTRIEAPMTWSPAIALKTFDPRVMRRIWEAQSFTKQAGQQALRTQVGDFLNMFWLNLALWGGMLWDPKRFPTMGYEFQKELHARSTETLSQAPLRMRLVMKLFMPKSFRKVKDMRRFASHWLKGIEGMGIGVWEYVEEVSRKDEHYFKAHESSMCWAFDNIGARVGFHGLGALAGMLKAFAKKELEWNVVETKCIGMGAPHCEFKAVLGETDELKSFLESIDGSVVERIHERLAEQLIGFVVEGNPLPERPGLGSEIAFNQMFMVASLPALVSERYRMAVRMGGARAGKELAERLMKAGVAQDEVIKRVIDFMEYCKVGKVQLGETVRMRENCESCGLETGQLTCFFTTGFLNGLFSVIKGQHVREVKCIAAGDPYCEWEII